MTQAQVPSEAEVFEYVKTLSNWGRWGPDDELGTMNHIGPEQRRQAAALVRNGVPVSCARTITFTPAPDSTSVAIHYMTRSGEGYANQPETFPPPMQGSGDFIGMAFHGYSITHLDSLCHIFWNGQMFNGRSSALVTTGEGATAESIELLQDGVVSRGVLLDAPRHRGVNWMDLGEVVLPSELDAIEEAQGIRVREGDILLVRTGHYRRRNEEGPRPMADGWPGLHASCLPWLRKRGRGSTRRRYRERRRPQRLSQPAAAHPPDRHPAYGSVAHRQLQPGGVDRGLRRKGKMGVPAHHRSPAHPLRDRLPGESNSAFLGKSANKARTIANKSPPAGG